MEKVIEWMISCFRLNRGDRVKNYGYFGGLLSIVLNIILFFIKFLLGMVFNSVALITDAFHTLSDVLTSFLVVIGFKLSAKPPDGKHPFGHGRVERIFALLIALLLIGGGIEFFLASLKRLINPHPIAGNLLVIIILILTILVKEFLTAVSRTLGEKIKSTSLKADAWHHRSDSITTGFVILGFIFYRFGLFRLDGLLGMGISALIVYTGIKIIIEAGHILVGAAPSPSLISQIKEIAQRIDGVKDVHEIQVHDYGRKIVVTIHICLKNDIHLDAAHKKADEVEKAIKEEMADAEVTIHLEPEEKIK